MCIGKKANQTKHFDSNSFECVLNSLTGTVLITESIMLNKSKSRTSWSLDQFCFQFLRLNFLL